MRVPNSGSAFGCVANLGPNAEGELEGNTCSAIQPLAEACVALFPDRADRPRPAWCPPFVEFLEVSGWLTGATDLVPRPAEGTVIAEHCVDGNGGSYDQLHWALEPHWLDATHNWWNVRNVLFEPITGALLSIQADSHGPLSAMDEAKYCCDPTGALTGMLVWGPRIDVICEGPGTWTWTPEDFQ
ncbi:MAG: hypothetical protein ABMB14_39205 [Myxococcota bacterium]